jgi:hypothetical protein
MLSGNWNGPAVAEFRPKDSHCSLPLGEMDELTKEEADKVLTEQGKLGAE